MNTDTPIIRRVNLALLFLISLCCALIFMLPLAHVFEGVEEGHGEIWKPLYLVNDFITLAFHIPYLIFWILYLFSKRKLLSGYFPILLLLAGLIPFIISGESLLLPAQDYKPAAGTLVSMLIFPLLVLQLFVQYGLNRMNKKGSSDSAST